MPELPEVETIRRALAPLDRRTVTEVTIRRMDVIEGLPASTREHRRSLLVGAVVTERLRHGKQLAIVAGDGRAVCIQLGMSGQVLCAPRPVAAGSHDHVVWTLDDGSTVTFRDPRRFGGITVLDSVEALRTRWACLGPDGLAVTGEDLARATHGRDRAIKAVLLDQNLIAGVGNIYADEALFEARIRPTRTAARLTSEDHERLAGAIRQILRDAVEAKGSSFRDYVQPDGSQGAAVGLHRVYGRGGESCTVCGGRLTETSVAQRTTVYCPRCQR